MADPNQKVTDEQKKQEVAKIHDVFNKRIEQIYIDFMAKLAEIKKQNNNNLDKENENES